LVLIKATLKVAPELQEQKKRLYRREESVLISILHYLVALKLGTGLSAIGYLNRKLRGTGIV